MAYRTLINQFIAYCPVSESSLHCWLEHGRGDKNLLFQFKAQALPLRPVATGASRMYVLSAGCRQDTEQRLTRKAWAPPRQEYIFVFVWASSAEPELNFKRRRLNGLEVRQRKYSWHRTIYMNQFTQTMPNVGLFVFLFCFLTGNKVLMGIRVIRSELLAVKKERCSEDLGVAEGCVFACSAFQAALENFLQLRQ